MLSSEPAPVVASALGIRMGATPRRRTHLTIPAPGDVPETGSFYLARNRNFLFGVDTVALTNKPAAMFPYVGRYAHP